MKKIISSIFISLVACNAYGAATWIDAGLTEADVLQKYQDRILHLSSATFSNSNNDLVTTIVTYDGVFRCAVKLPQAADKIVEAIDEPSYCLMIKPPEEEKKKKKKKKRSRN